MKRSHLLLLTLAAFLLYLGLAQLQQYPGYMDADYHFYMGLRLAAGEGFSEQILWNYLDDPQGLPHPSHSYWGLWPSLLAALGIRLFPNLEYFPAARLPFITLASILPALVSLLAFRLTKERKLAWLAALIALSSTYYLPYLLTTESFTPSMVLGALLALLLLKANKGVGDAKIFTGTGLVLGLLFLTRSEGLLWLGLVSFLLLRSKTARLNQYAFLLAGFLVLALPWLVRNQVAFGTLLAPGGARVLWMQSYDDLFAYPAGTLSASSFIQQGLMPILENWFWALGQNALSTLAVLAAILLLPFIIGTMYKDRGSILVQFAFFGWLSVFALMSLAFPFAGVRGGFFHAGALLQPLLWGLATKGFGDFLGWGQRQRGWDERQAFMVLGSGLLLLLVGLSAFNFSQRVNGLDGVGQAWNRSSVHYAQIADALEELGYPEATVLVNNPPGFAAQAGQAAIVIPNGDEALAFRAAQDFGAEIMLLEFNHPQGLSALFADPHSSQFFEHLQTLDGSHILGLRQNN